MLIKKLKTQENEGATSKYPEYTDIKVSGHILEVFMALKNIFFSDFCGRDWETFASSGERLCTVPVSLKFY